MNTSARWITAFLSFALFAQITGADAFAAAREQSRSDNAHPSVRRGADERPDAPDLREESDEEETEADPRSLTLAIQIAPVGGVSPELVSTFVPENIERPESPRIRTRAQGHGAVEPSGSSSDGGERSGEAIDDRGRRMFDGTEPPSERASGYLEIPELGAHVYYEFQPGQGTPYGLVHGLSVDMDSWNEVSSRLSSRGFPILRIDLLGHGKTLEHALAHGGPEYGTIRDNAIALRAVIEHLNLRRIVLAGHSYGGGVILELMALPLKTTVEKLVPIVPYTERLDPYYRRMIPWWLPIGFWTRWMEMFFPSWVDASARMVGAWMMMSMLPDLIRRENARLGRSISDPQIQQRAKAAVGTMLASIDFRAERLASGISDDLEIVLVSSPDDPKIPKEPTDRFYEAFRRAGKRIKEIAIRGADHFLIFKVPERIVNILTGR